MKKLRILMAALCVAALMCAVTVTAYAGAPDYEETGGYEPPAEAVTETPAPEPVAEEEHFELLPGQGFSEDGNLLPAICSMTSTPTSSLLPWKPRAAISFTSSSTTTSPSTRPESGTKPTF